MNKRKKFKGVVFNFIGYRSGELCKCIDCGKLSLVDKDDVSCSLCGSFGTLDFTDYDKNSEDVVGETSMQKLLTNGYVVLTKGYMFEYESKFFIFDEFNSDTNEILAHKLEVSKESKEIENTKISFSDFEKYQKSKECGMIRTHAHVRKNKKNQKLKNNVFIKYIIYRPVTSIYYNILD